MLDSGTTKVRVVTTGGNALEALGEAAAKVKNGTTLAAVGRADIAPATNSVGMRAIAEKRPTSYGKAVASVRLWQDKDRLA
jgi:hypothetical protein